LGIWGLGALVILVAIGSSLFVVSVVLATVGCVSFWFAVTLVVLQSPDLSLKCLASVMAIDFKA
jgi:hypothetical protein